MPIYVAKPLRAEGPVGKFDAESLSAAVTRVRSTADRLGVRYQVLGEDGKRLLFTVHPTKGANAAPPVSSGESAANVSTPPEAMTGAATTEVSEPVVIPEPPDEARCVVVDSYGNRCERPTPHDAPEGGGPGDHYACGRTFREESTETVPDPTVNAPLEAPPNEDEPEEMPKRRRGRKSS